MNSLNRLASARYAIVVAHPDDEVLWFNSVLSGASKIIICYGDLDGDIDLGSNRRKVMASYPLDSLYFLDLPEGGFYNKTNWENPRCSSVGVMLKLKEDQCRYRNNFNILIDKLSPLLSDIDCVFTHNPWGEYGHEDHVQIFHVINSLLLSKSGGSMFVPSVFSEKSYSLRSKHVGANQFAKIQQHSNPVLAYELKHLYCINNCWTWHQDWSPTTQEEFISFMPSRHIYSEAESPPTLKRIGGMATIPSRCEGLPLVLESILPSLDHLYLWFDIYEDIPKKYMCVEKITPILGISKNARLGCSGKFFGLRMISEKCHYFCFDDDIIYPTDYVPRLSAAIRRYGGRHFVGVHGNNYHLFPGSYAHDRTCLHFRDQAPFDCSIDELGTGTIAFQNDVMPIDIDGWKYGNMSDLNLMIDCVRYGIDRISIRRPQNWLRAIATNQPDSIWRGTQKDDRLQTKILNEAMLKFKEGWAMSFG